jgi:hypothetical protein
MRCRTLQHGCSVSHEEATCDVGLEHAIRVDSLSLDESKYDVGLCNMGRFSLDESTCNVGPCNMGRVSLDKSTCDVGLSNMGRVSLDESTWDVGKQHV